MTDQRSPLREWSHGAAACADLGVFAVDAETSTVTLDARAAEMLGLAADREVRFDEYLAVVEPVDRQAVAQHVAAAIASGINTYHDEYKTIAKRWITADGRMRQDRAGGRAALLGVMCDVTLRRTTDDARTRLVDEMARSLRFNDMLIGVVAHDLRSPLAAIVTAAEQLRHQVPDPRMSNTTSRIAGSAERMSRVVHQMLDLTHSRLDGQIPLHVQPTDLAAIARDVATEIMASKPACAIAVETRADTTCECDPDRVAQIVSNLLVNAVRHGVDPKAVVVVIDGTGSRVVSITVKNPGTIAAELVPGLFNPFRRAQADGAPRDRRHGLGLGLYIARRIAIGHAGDITVTTSAEGTSFRVELPRVAIGASFSLTPDRAEEEEMSLERLGLADQTSRVTAALFGVLPISEREPEAFASLVERHTRLLDLALERQIFRETNEKLATELRGLAEQLGALGGGANDVADLHSTALQRAIKGAPAVRVQALVAEGRLVALELMGRLVTVYRKRSGFGSLARGKPEAAT